MTDIALQSDRVDVRLTRLGPERGPPVLLVPGLAAASRVFTLNDRLPLADALLADGRTPWAVDFFVRWRRPDQDGAGLLHALEVALAELRRATGVDLDAVDAVGHSLGGMLLLALAADGVPFRKLVTLGSAVDFRTSRGARAFGAAVPVARRLQGRVRHGIPLRRLAAAAAPLAARRVPIPAERGQFHRGTTSPATTRRFFAEAVHDLSFPLLLDLAALFGRDGLRFGDGPPLRDAVARLRMPALVIGGRVDRTCAIAAVRRLARTLPRGELLEVDGPGFGHLDLLTAGAAVDAVFAPLRAFLAR